ncbi:hypothetical protein N7474_008747 [Penicillium riverlandense]|uniref:uncharacterized protein n=1 Tax=Penicillium riverlandense TaxID=1903569 RepID=UPI002546F333|nr:uncharacterized protein N7474_008747 [Penicillium riverlandense]KAJ5812446.1 hypothetical protein N7474_008747 [Penicillium riverlandense]
MPESYRRKRKALSCEDCRHSKLRCDRKQPCSSCKRRGREASCSFWATPSVASASTNAHRTPPRPRALDVPRVNPTTSQSDPSRQEIPGRSGIQLEPVRPGEDRDIPDSHWETVLERPVPEPDPVAVPDTASAFPLGLGMTLKSIIENLPPRNCCDYLVSHFFIHISALFPILHGPTFQKQYTAFMQQPDKVDLSWLALLFTMCSLILNTMEPSDPRLAELWSNKSHCQEQEIVAKSRQLQQIAMICLSQDQFFIRHKLSTFEALLMVVYNLSHNESVDQGWALLGMALNIGIALRCNIDSQDYNPIERERRRRCWAGLLSLHTYQVILFRDVDMTFLLEIKSTLPADVNDSDITEEGVGEASSKPTQMSVMMFKVRLFRLSTKICHHISSASRFEVASLNKFDAAITEEQRLWDSTYLKDGSPSILDSTYSHWCLLQTYAHHLYLLLHRPFHHSQSPNFISSSRDRCISSGLALVVLHRQLYEVPLLRHILWLLNGVASLKALHAAVALNSCLLDMPPSFESEPYRVELDKLALRMEDLSNRSAICRKAHRILRHLQAQSGIENPQPSNPETLFESTFEDWTDMREWFDADLFNWVLQNSPTFYLYRR